jgi:hypothetical protein
MFLWPNTCPRVSRLARRLPTKTRTRLGISLEKPTRMVRDPDELLLRTVRCGTRTGYCIDSNLTLLRYLTPFRMEQVACTLRIAALSHMHFGMGCLVIWVWQPRLRCPVARSRSWLFRSTSRTQALDSVSARPASRLSSRSKQSSVDGVHLPGYQTTAL